jgi:hypothetical protein
MQKPSQLYAVPVHVRPTGAPTWGFLLEEDFCQNLGFIEGKKTSLWRKDEVF